MAAEHLLPVDPNVQLPPSVLRAAAAANELHGRAYPKAPGQPNTGEPQPYQNQPQANQGSPQEPTQATQQEPQQQPQQAQAQPQQPQEPVQAPVQPAAQPVEPTEDENNQSWKHRYLSMKGRYEASQVNLGQMQEVNSQLADELSRRVEPPQQPQQQQPQRQQPIIRRLTDQEIATYGPELIQTIQRAALDAVEPELNSVRQTTQQTRQQVAQDKQVAFYADISELVPTWRQINNSDRFKLWCRKPDVYSGMLRGQLLKAAWSAADAPRAAAFFKGFLEEERATGNASNPQAGKQANSEPPRQAAVQLETLAAPGRPNPATGSSSTSAADKPVYTHAQVRWFFSNAGRQYYVGREEERKADERDLFAAQKEGRIR